MTHLFKLQNYEFSHHSNTLFSCKDFFHNIFSTSHFQVDDIQLAGYTNQEAVEILKQTGKVVKLSVVRYLRGLKFEELQEGITQANVATPTSPYPQTPVTPQGSNDDLLMGDDRLNSSHDTVIDIFSPELDIGIASQNEHKILVPNSK